MIGISHVIVLHVISVTSLPLYCVEVKFGKVFIKAAEKGMQIFPIFIYFSKWVSRFDSLGNKQPSSAAGIDRSPLISRHPH